MTAAATHRQNVFEVPVRLVKSETVVALVAGINVLIRLCLRGAVWRNNLSMPRRVGTPGMPFETLPTSEGPSQRLQAEAVTEELDLQARRVPSHHVKSPTLHVEEPS